jgi:5'-3' exonuclease
VLVSADKDLSQLLGEFDEQWDYGRGQRWGSAGVKARHGVHAHQIADYLALCGDAVDNIPGVPGIGAKTAALIVEYRQKNGPFKKIEEFRHMGAFPFSLWIHGHARACSRSGRRVQCKSL